MKRLVPSLVLASFSETTVSAALRATSPGLASTAFRYVTPFGSTHDAGSTFDLPGPARRADKLAQPKAAQSMYENRAKIPNPGVSKSLTRSETPKAFDYSRGAADEPARSMQCRILERQRAT